MARMERIRIEYDHVQDNMPEGCSVFLKRGNVENWIIIIYGPDQSPYEGGCFRVNCTFPDNYPSGYPNCVMDQDNIMHMNINTSGRICLGLFGSQWNESITMAAVIEYIRYLISNPNPGSPWPSWQSLADLYKDNHPEYLRQVSEHTRTHAM